eukprot:GHVS01100213.1.p1 GENE.GHVS01100213.1~~GHVS01100213.1.p1  ORF type:complete len:137 (-),score=5.39 GHVS01100213.1:176-586(-)
MGILTEPVSIETIHRKAMVRFLIIPSELPLILGLPAARVLKLAVDCSQEKPRLSSRTEKGEWEDLTHTPQSTSESMNTKGTYLEVPMPEKAKIDDLEEALKLITDQVDAKLPPAVRRKSTPSVALCEPNYVHYPKL